MTPTPSLIRRAAQAGLVTGIAAVSAAVLLPSGSSSAASPAPTVTVAAQTAAEPAPVSRASRSRALAPKQLPMKTVVKTVATGATFSGQASWYGGSFQGQRTANGERFDTNDLTAASKTLPFGTRVRVCHSGCVVVRINDRGPYVGGRVLDLSRAAAHAVGIYGVGHVTATPVGTRSVRVVDTAFLARQRAVASRHAALVARSEARRAAAARRQAEAAAEAARAVPAAASTPLDQPRVPVAAAGGLLSSASAGLLGLRRKRP
jgi:rare lipoprotein A